MALAHPPYHRPVFSTILARLEEPRRFIQVLAGPRQAGKTTLARQVLEALELPGHYASADHPSLRDRIWLGQQWEAGRLLARDAPGGAVLVLDEIQKVTEWSSVVKGLWDEDTGESIPLKVMILGSAPLLVRRGLGESLAGRFEVIRIPHWSYSEMKAAFAWSLEEYLYFGGYPGAAPLVKEEERWARYILDALVETTLSRDVLLLTRVDKPALLRQLFELARAYSGQILSYQKMLGQLQDAGNTTTLAHYLDLLAGAGMVMGLQKFSGTVVRRRGSSPKLQILNTALMTAGTGVSFSETRRNPELWGRLVETAVGAHLVNTSAGTDVEVLYWRDRGREVDFVVRAGRHITALEVKSGARPTTLPGMDAFDRAFSPGRKLLVGAGGIPMEDFFQTGPELFEGG
jgi:uncharacterized protein